MSPESPGVGSARYPGPYNTASTETIGFDFKWLYSILWKRKVLSFLLFIGLTVSGFFGALWISPLYQAEVILKIEERKKAYEQERYTDVVVFNQEFYGAQEELLKSRKLAQEVISTLHLDTYPEFSKSQSILKRLLPFLPKKSNQPTNPNERLTQLTNIYLEKLEVIPSRKSPQIISIRFTAGDPDLAAKIINTHAEFYINSSSNKITQYTGNVILGLEEQIKKLDQDIEQAEKEFLTFQKEHNTMGIYSSLDKDKVISDYEDCYQKLWEEYVTANNTHNQLKSSYEILFEEGHVGDKNHMKEDALSSPLIKTLSINRNEILLEWSRIKEKYLENHPDYIEKQNELLTVEQSIHEEADQIVAQAKQAYEESAVYLKNVSEQLETLKKDNFEKKAQWNKHRDLEQTWDQLVEEKSNLLKSRQIAKGTLKTQQEMPNQTFEIMDYAETPIRPINQNWFRTITLLLMFSFAIVVLIALFIEYVSGGINGSTPPVDQTTDLPVLGSIPLFSAKEIASIKEHIDFSSSSPIGETFISLRSRFLYSDALPPMQTALFTSASGQEGKSLITALLAASVAMTGKRTAILDCDLNQPSLHQFFKRASEPGLTDVIQDPHALDSLLTETYIPGLYYIPAGVRNQPPSEFYNSQTFDDILQTLKNEFDYIFIDTSPVFSTQSPTLLSRKMDATFMVVRSGKITNDEMLLAANHIARAGGQVSAVIMNAAMAYQGFAIQNERASSQENALPEMT